MTPMPFFSASLPSEARRPSHFLAHGQALQVKTTRVPFAPFSPASVTSLPSTFLSLVSAMGIVEPSANGVGAGAAASCAQAENGAATRSTASDSRDRDFITDILRARGEAGSGTIQ